MYLYNFLIAVSSVHAVAEAHLLIYLFIFDTPINIYLGQEKGDKLFLLPEVRIRDEGAKRGRGLRELIITYAGNP
jgi:hypothetical protein